MTGCVFCRSVSVLLGMGCRMMTSSASSQFTAYFLVSPKILSEVLVLKTTNLPYDSNCQWIASRPQRLVLANAGNAFATGSWATNHKQSALSAAPQDEVKQFKGIVVKRPRFFQDVGKGEPTTVVLLTEKRK